MADPTPTPSTLDKLLALTGKASIYIPVAGQFVSIATVGLEEFAKFLDTSGADLSELDKLHTEFQARIAARAAQQVAPGPTPNPA